MKRNTFLLIALLMWGCSHAPHSEDVVFQNAPINALMAGCYGGTMSVHDLKKHGDFGLGTLDALDGEMIVLDHSFYQIKPDGKAYLLTDAAMSPFAAVTFFKSGQEFSPGKAMGYKELIRFLDEKLSSLNLIYAVKVEGKFSALKVRSAARQKRPFPVLTEAIEEQKVFELKNLEGTLVGFRYPPYMGGINVPGYHVHFLSKDRTAGGHVLDFQAEELNIEIDPSQKFLVEFPGNEEFLKFRSVENSEEAIAKVER